MKKTFPILYAATLMLVAVPGFAQKYKQVSDTAKLNKEYVSVSNDIADLNAKLTIAQNDMPGYQTKARDANADAANAASASSDQALKAQGGTVKDARRAKRKAGKAYSEAKDSRSADKRVSSQEDKITRYQLDIKKKQQRLKELDLMRAAINVKMQADPAQVIQQ